jgi:hypothetical protein
LPDFGPATRCSMRSTVRCSAANLSTTWHRCSAFVAAFTWSRRPSKCAACRSSSWKCPEAPLLVAARRGGQKTRQAWSVHRTHPALHTWAAAPAPPRQGPGATGRRGKRAGPPCVEGCEFRAALLLPTVRQGCSPERVVIRHSIRPAEAEQQLRVSVKQRGGGLPGVGDSCARRRQGQTHGEQGGTTRAAAGADGECALRLASGEG